MFKRFWLWLKRALGCDPAIYAELDAKVGHAEMQFLISLEGRALTQHELQMINMLAMHSYVQEVRAKAMAMIRTGDVVSETLKNYQDQVNAGNTGRKKQILDAMLRGPCGQQEIRSRLKLGDDEMIADMCWSLCLELESEGKLIEKDGIWQLAPVQTAQQQSG